MRRKKTKERQFTSTNTASLQYRAGVVRIHGAATVPIRKEKRFYPLVGRHGTAGELPILWE